MMKRIILGGLLLFAVNGLLEGFLVDLAARALMATIAGLGLAGYLLAYNGTFDEE